MSFSPSAFMREVFAVYFALLKILVPALVVIKLLELVGAIQWLAAGLSPLMDLVGLPGDLGIVWATALMTNIFTGLVVLFEVWGENGYTVADMTVLGALLLTGHALPVEGAVAKRAGVPWWVILTLRIGGGLVFAGILSQIYRLQGWGQNLAQIGWRPDTPSGLWLDWFIAQGQSLLVIFGVITALMVVLRLIRRLGLEDILHDLLSPLLRVLGIGKAAANVTVIGTTLGLSYGAGLLIRDLDRGIMSRRDSFLALCFLSLCHSVIEDTLLILLLGTDLWAILGVRLVFAFVVVAIIARLPQTQSLKPLKARS